MTKRPILWAAGVLVVAGAVLAVVLASGGSGLPGAKAAAPGPTTIGPEWRSFRADVTGIRPGPDPFSLFVQVALPGPDPDCVREPRIEQVTEAKTDIRADVVYSTRPAAGGCEDKVPAELRLATTGPVADRTVILNADNGNAWHKLGAGFGVTAPRRAPAPRPPTTATRRGSARRCPRRAPRAAAPPAPATRTGWSSTCCCTRPNRRRARPSAGATCGWTAFAQAKSAGCAEIRAADPKFPAALCKALPATSVSRS